MRERLRRAWVACSIVVPLASGLGWLVAGQTWPAAIGAGTAFVNAALLVRRRIPLRIPAFVAPRERQPVVIDQLRWPGNG